MQLIDKELLDSVGQQAKDSSRLRMNYNFHETPDAPVQKLLNALELGTVLPVHRHCHTSETYILLRGKLKVMIYSEQKELLDSIVLDPLEGCYGVDIKAGEWHAIEVLESGTTIFEVKDGPYTPLVEEDIL